MPAKIKEESTANHGRLREVSMGPAMAIKTDPDKGILFDVLFLGHKSRNRTDYSGPVMEAALPLYEGAQSYVGHTKDGTNPEFDRSFGVPRNCRVAPDGLRGDYHFPPKHRLAEQLLWAAENNPRAVGFSHDADCTYDVQNGRRVVTAIERVYSVDLVTRPGTTRGLFEDEEEVLADDPKLAKLAETCLPAIDNVRSILFTREETIEAKTARIQESLAVWGKALNTEPAAAGDTSLKEEEHPMGVEFKDITVEALTKERPDIIAKLQGTDEHSRLTEEVKTLTEAGKAKDAELATLKAEKAKRVKEEEILTELKEAKFPTGDEVAYSATFKESLSAAADKTARAALISDRMGLLTTARVQEGILPSPLADLRPTEKPDRRDTAHEARFFGA